MTLKEKWYILNEKHFIQNFEFRCIVQGLVSNEKESQFNLSLIYIHANSAVFCNQCHIYIYIF